MCTVHVSICFLCSMPVGSSGFVAITQMRYEMKSFRNIFWRASHQKLYLFNCLKCIIDHFRCWMYNFVLVSSENYLNFLLFVVCCLLFIIWQFWCLVPPGGLLSPYCIFNPVKLNEYKNTNNTEIQPSLNQTIEHVFEIAPGSRVCAQPWPSSLRLSSGSEWVD